MMKRVTTAALAALLGALTLCACGNSGEFSDDEKISAKYKRSTDAAVTYNYADGALEAPNSYNDFSTAASDFAAKQLAGCDNQKSFVCSPASGVLQLSMLANAASSDAKTAVINAVGGSAMSLDMLNTDASYFKSRMESVSKANGKSAWQSVTLDGAMFADDGVEVKSSFLQTAADFYGYDVFRYDFQGENAEKKQDSYLKKYSSDSGIEFKDSSTLNMVSACEVKDSWLSPYAEADVKNGSFNGAGGAIETAFLTSNEAKLQSGKATGVLKYTEKNPLKLLLVMPNDGVKLNDYIKDFNGKELAALLGSMDITKQTTAVIPEFSVKQDGKAAALAGSFGKSGLAALFAGGESLSALSYTTKAVLGDMYEILPDFTLNRAGINAGNNASSAEKSSVKKTDDSVVFDKPFLFLLLDNESNLPVMMGVYRG